MKTNSLVLRLVRVFTEVAWYLNFLFFAIILAFITFFFFSSNQFSTSIAAQYRIPPQPVGGVKISEIMVNASLKLTPLMIVTTYFFLFLFEGLVAGTLYHLRKVFKAIRQLQPFSADNIKSLKTIALIFALATPVKIVYGLIIYSVVSHRVPDFHNKYMMVWHEDFIGLTLGAVIYIIADTFNYGLQLKKETEEFV